jgi:hypothetical protein
MRYYDISILVGNPGQAQQLVVPWPFKGITGATSGTNPLTGAPSTTAIAGSSYTNYINGQIVNGLDIEIQIRNYLYGNIQGALGSYVTLHGVSLQEISQQNQLSSTPQRQVTIVVKAGMQKGLPLAKPQQSGVLSVGQIWQCIGNWEGIDKTLTFMIYNVPVSPANFQFIWRKGTWLGDALQTTLSLAYPFYKPNIFINQGLVATKDYNGTYSGLSAFNEMLKKLTTLPQYNFTTITGSPYAGVNIMTRPSSNQKITASPGTLPGGTPNTSLDIVAFDMTVPYQDSRLPTSPILLEAEDFIGQPSWIEPTVVRFKTVMRADIRVGDFVKFPQTPFGSTFISTPPNPSVAWPGAPSRNQLAFQSVFFIRSVNHYGRLYQPDAGSWVSVFEGIFATINPASPTAVQSLPTNAPAGAGPAGGLT